MRAMEHWAFTQDAGLMGLPVVSTNAATIGFYKRLGFVAGATNCYWMRPD